MFYHDAVHLLWIRLLCLISQYWASSSQEATLSEDVLCSTLNYSFPLLFCGLKNKENTDVWLLEILKHKTVEKE